MFAPAVPIVPKLRRNAAIAGGVVLFHLGALWVLQTGLLRTTPDLVIPVRLMSDIVAAPQPQPETQPAAAEPQTSQRVQQSVAKKRDRERRPAAQARVSQPPAPSAPAMEAQPKSMPQAQPMPPQAAARPTEPHPPTVGGEANAAVPRTSTKVEPPSSHASYLQNPPLVYPPISKRLGEEGKVIVRVLIGEDGVPQRAELTRSSGFERLDQSALEYVMKCRYVPGKVGGVPRAMWHEAPVSFVLQ